MRTRWLAPVLLGAALPLAARGGTPPPDAGEGSCLVSGCHAGLAEGEGVHGAVLTEMCEACHASTGEGHRFKSPAPIAAACLTCHDDPRKGGGLVHGPADRGECTACHEPHRSGVRKLLRRELPDLCWSCHDHPLERAEGRTAVRNVRKEALEGPVVHGALESGCDTCHPAHASARAGLFVDAFPAGPYARGHDGSYTLCFTCHDESMLDPGQPQGTGFRDLEKNLHAAHVARAKSRSCALCHSPHGGGPHLLRSAARFGNWEMPLVYEPQEDGGSCLPACHEKRRYRQQIAAEEAPPARQPR